ncbi:FadR family transcriptional regulator [Rhodobacter sp. NTK016B]|uniref:FadR/GntR family transcriptional regulator n=1 Tax=Rhodobacter sp. NTK016B TaxID=2759676 RepID=UPI001A8CC007|nr:FCD domain-containing protein [Rhodobacter sp. NTK016B]MBN8293332.1 FadR family transcriptional regulator [Rhodobacter sp. NTK016B]
MTKPSPKRAAASSRASRTAPRRSRPVRVAEEIKDWVVDRNLKKGDRLPSEPELIAQFGMAKGTIREAMRILEAQGLIETRTGPGGGSFIGEVTADRAKALLANYFYFTELSVADIYQLRKALEPELVASLAGKLDEAQIAELEAVVAQYPEPAQDAEEEREQHIASLVFHRRLANFSNNPLLAFVVSFMARILTDLTVYRQLYDPPNRELYEKGTAYQKDLIAALKEGRGEEARAIMRAHMETAEALMQLQEAKVLRRFIAE